MVDLTGKEIELTDQEAEFIDELREQGRAVTVFLPYALDAASLQVVVEKMCEAFYDAIDMLEGGDDDEDEADEE